MAAKHRSQWSGPPRHGTKSNEIFRRLLKGLRSDIAAKEFGQHSLTSTVETLRNMCGYDIRSFKSKEIGEYEQRSNRRGRRHPNVLMIVGRHKWKGGYVSFIDPQKYGDLIG